MRLKNIEKLQVRAKAALETDDRDEARAIVRDLIAFERREPRLARARAALAGHIEEIIDGADLIRLLRHRAIGARLIAYSADEGGLKEALAAGADVAVLKTGEAADLLAAVAAA